MNKVKYNNIQIEEWGADAVKAAISKTDTLHAFIEKNDKRPFWDGEVFIYKSNDWRNINFIGKVQVQVKGKAARTKDLLKSEISFSPRVVDLLNYEKNSGVIYFVVLIDKENNEHRKIYYNELTPHKIRTLIEGKEEQKTLRVLFKEFPLNKFNIQNLFHRFHLSSSQSYLPIITIDKLNTIKDIEKITFTVIEANPDLIPKNTYDILFHDKAFWTVKQKGHPTPYQIEIAEKIDLKISTLEKQDIIVNGEKFEKYLSIERGSDYIAFKFGESVILKYPKDGKKGKLTYTHSDKLTQRIKDFNFLILFMENALIQKENGETIELGAFNKETEFNISELKKELQTYLQIDEFWKSIGVYDEFIIGNINLNSSMEELEVIANSINGKYNVISGLDTNNPVTLVKKAISNFTLLLFFVVEDKDKKKFKIYNFTDYERKFVYIIDGKEHEASRYSALKPIDYIEVSNINFSDILKSFKQIKITDNNIYTYFNLDLLKLLMAYDMHENKPHKILKAAQDIAKWLLDKSDDDLQNEIKVINYLQALKRERTLTDKENIKLYEIERNSEELLYKIGANILLDNYKVAQIQFEKLSDVEKEKFKTFPIYNLWKPSSKKTSSRKTFSK